jgi:surfeit locus 1 family protein
MQSQAFLRHKLDPGFRRDDTFLDESSLSSHMGMTKAIMQSPWAALQPTASRRRFRPRWWPTLAAAVLVPLFICAGQWQWNKAASKAQLQAQLAARRAEPAIQAPQGRADAQSLSTLRYRTVVATGRYEPEHQILIDNRTQHGQAGYHIITPLRVDGSEVRLLINRGWLPAPAEHSRVPEFATPTGTIDISGTAIIPPAHFFTLAKDSATASPDWHRVWQNLDLEAYALTAGFPIQPFVIELDTHSAAGGFVREWRAPDDRRETNLGYAFQWWAFAATTAVLWLVLNFRRPAGPILP